MVVLNNTSSILVPWGTRFFFLVESLQTPRTWLLYMPQLHYEIFIAKPPLLALLHHSCCNNTCKQ